MKKVSTTFLLWAIVAFGAFAQNCYTGPTNITPMPSAQPGLTPPSQDLPCMVVGQQTSDTIYFTNFTSFNGLTVNSLTIDSIGNLPTGTCWTSSSSTNTFTGGQSGVILVHGLVSAAPGQYSLQIYVTVDIQGLGSIGPSNAGTLAGLYYWVRVKCPAAVCTALDTTNGKTQEYIPYAACSNALIASISPAGIDSICPGSLATLTANTGTGYTYLWSDPSHSTSQSITVGAGSYTVTVYANGDTAISSSTTVAVGSDPSAMVTLTGSNTFCQGGSATISAPQGNGYTYNWTNNSTTRTIAVTSSGSYTVTVTNSYGCTAVSTPEVITVNAAPTAVISSNGFLLSAQSATSYQWFLNNSALPEDTLQTLTATQNGVYTVTVTGANGCTATSNGINITNVGVNEIPSAIAIRLYPNPSEGLLTLEAPGCTGSNYEIADQLGRIVQKGTVPAESSLVNVSSQQSGVYYLTIKNAKQNGSIRFVIMK